MKYGSWIKITFSVGLLGWFLINADLRQLRAILTGIPSGEIFLIICLYAGAWLVNTAKWNVLLGGQTFVRLLTLTMIGQFYALVLPGQLAGEVVKAWKLIGRTGQAATIVASILMDRLTGVVSLLIVGFIGASFTTSAVGSASAVVFGSTIFCFVLAAFLLRLQSFRTWCRKSLSTIRDRIPYATGLAGTLMDCVDAWIDDLSHLR